MKKYSTLAMLIVILVVLITFASKRTDILSQVFPTSQRATDWVADGGPYPAPPTKAYRLSFTEKSKLAYVYQQFLDTHAGYLGDYLFNTTWTDPITRTYSVVRGGLLLRAFGYKNAPDPITKKYWYGGGGGVSTYRDGCYEKVLAPGSSTLYQDVIWVEKPVKKFSFGLDYNKTVCCNGQDKNNILRGELYDPTDQSKVCCPSGRVLNTFEYALDGCDSATFEGYPRYSVTGTY